MIAGPAYRAAAAPVSTKMPAPMMAPIPSVTRLTGPRALLRLCSPVSAASFISVLIDFVANKGLPMQLLLPGMPTNLVVNIVGAQQAAPLQENSVSPYYARGRPAATTIPTANRPAGR